MNKKVLIGLGVLAVAGVAFYMWKKKKGSESSESETKSEEKANAFGRIGRVSQRVSPSIVSASRVTPIIANNRVVSVPTPLGKGTGCGDKHVAGNTCLCSDGSYCCACQDSDKSSGSSWNQK